MLKKEYMIIGFLAFCLTATLFIGVTTSGNEIDEDITQFPWTKTVENTNPATTSTAEYDPWCDINDDGVINIIDIVSICIRFGTKGTPINKTALLLELQSKIESLNASLVELEVQVQSLNLTIEVLTNRSTGVPKFLYSNGGYFDLVKMCEEGTTGWVTAKTATIPANTLTNGTVVVYFNLVSYCYLVQAFSCKARIVVAGVEKAYWSWGPPLNNPPASYLPMDTTYKAVKLSGINNTVDVTMNLDFRIDCSQTYMPTQAYARISNNQFIVEG